MQVNGFRVVSEDDGDVVDGENVEATSAAGAAESYLEIFHADHDFCRELVVLVQDVLSLEVTKWRVSAETVWMFSATPSQ